MVLAVFKSHQTTPNCHTTFCFNSTCSSTPANRKTVLRALPLDKLSKLLACYVLGSLSIDTDLAPIITNRLISRSHYPVSRLMSRPASPPVPRTKLPPDQTTCAYCRKIGHYRSACPAPASLASRLRHDQSAPAQIDIKRNSDPRPPVEVSPSHAVISPASLLQEQNRLLRDLIDAQQQEIKLLREQNAFLRSANSVVARTPSPCPDSETDVSTQTSPIRPTLADVCRQASSAVMPHRRPRAIGPDFPKPKPEAEPAAESDLAPEPSETDTEPDSDSEPVAEPGTDRALPTTAPKADYVFSDFSERVFARLDKLIATQSDRYELPKEANADQRHDFPSTTLGF
jgi:hypothetical protein